jgi:trimeric autotransporter adhesin
MRKAFFFFVIACTFLFTNVHVQIGIGTNTPDPAAILEVSSSNKGLLIPRVALTGINDVTTIPSAPPSLLVYNTATAGATGFGVIPGYYYWNGTVWLNLATLYLAASFPVIIIRARKKSVFC